MKGRILTIRDISQDDERAWRILAARAMEPNPFFEPDCLIPAAIHQTFGAEIGLVVAEHEGRFLACIPVRHVRRWKFPYPILTSQVRRMGYLGTPLVDPEGGVDAMVTLLESMRGLRRAATARLLVIDGMSAEGPVSDLFRLAVEQLNLPCRVFESYDRGLLKRRDEPTYDNVHSSKTRYNLRRQRRLLEQDVRCDITVVDRADHPGAIRDYIEMEASGYKVRTGVAMTTVPGEPEYFSDMCERFASAGRLHILSLEADGQRLAMEIWIRAGEGMFLMKISFDEKFSRFGPGVLLQMSALQYFHWLTDAEWIDTCTSAGNALLLRLYPDRRRIESLFVVLGRSPVDRAVIKTFTAARPLHNRLYQLRHPDHVPVGAGHP
jgi:CelD/BcsL family acetyltransferase involved in cellulose biosynthesis